MAIGQKAWPLGSGICFIPNNILRNTSSTASWQTTSGVGTDYTNIDRPTTYLSNGMPGAGSKPTGQGVSTYYIHGTCVASDVDTVFIQTGKFHNDDTSTITVKLDDQASMATAVTVATFANVPQYSRAISLMTTQYSGVTAWEIAIAHDGAQTTPPIIGQVVLGTRQQLSHNITRGSDDESEGMLAASWNSRMGDTITYVYAQAFHDLDATYKFNHTFESTDLTKIQTIYAASNYGQHAVVYVPYPQTATSTYPHKALLGRLNAQGALSIPRQVQQSRQWHINFSEVSPFWGGDAGHTF